MNLSERLTVIFLTLFDHIMNLITLGYWGKVRGDEIVVIKLRK